MRMPAPLTDVLAGHASIAKWNHDLTVALFGAQAPERGESHPPGAGGEVW